MSTTQGFNADERATAREQAPHIIGGKTFHRLRVTNQLYRVIRGLGRDQAKHNRDEIKFLELISAINLEAPDDEITRLQAAAGVETRDIDELQAKADEHEDEAIDISYQIVAAHLADEDGENPPLEFLKEHLDTLDMTALRRIFRGEPADPPSTPTSESASG